MRCSIFASLQQMPYSILLPQEDFYLTDKRGEALMGSYYNPSRVPPIARPAQSPIEFLNDVDGKLGDLVAKAYLTTYVALDDILGYDYTAIVMDTVDRRMKSVWLFGGEEIVYHTLQVRSKYRGLRGIFTCFHNEDN